MITKYKKIINVSIINILNCTAEYISLVVLALHLNTNITIVQTAIIIGIPQMSSTFLGTFSSILERKFGTIKCMCVSSFLTGIAYIGLALSKRMLSYVVFSFLWGFAIVLWKPIIKSMFSSCSEELKKPDNVHRIRYITICISSIFGPLLGVLIADNYSRALCLVITGIINIIIGLYVGIVFSYAFTINKGSIQIKNENMSKSYIFVKDKILLIYILTGSLVYFVFVQFENIYSLFLTSYPSPDRIFSILLILNSICGLIFQFFLIVKIERLSAQMSVLIGNTFFQVSFFIFGFSFLLMNQASLYLLCIAVIIYSLGEVLTIPSLDIVIDNIAPNDKKSLYFGIAEIRNIGFTLGPIFAGYLLEVKNAAFASFSSVIILLLANMIFLLGKRLQNKDSSNVVSELPYQ
jgi:MFS family permease